ncbi:MAG: hypothetical protein SGI88_18055 [Candidatus Hydrogenedentes bacterium]|nr:hypothetical protein [Candidatus Hydrogenedentota bacterium]
MSYKRKDDDGIALILVVLAILVILAALTTVFNRVQTAKLRTDEAVATARLDEAIKAGVDLAIENVWNEYLEGNGNTTGNLASYLVFADALVDTNEDTNGDGTMDGTEYDANGDGTFASNPGGVDIVTEADALRLSSGEQILGVNVERMDDVTGTVFTLTATARSGNRMKSGVQTVRVSGQPFRGFEFGILANNINCIMCHAEINSLDLFRNTDPDMYGEFDRVKMAALESLMIRTNENISTEIAGTTYTRGQVYNHAWSTLNATSLASSNFKAFQFSSSNGKINQNSSGGLTTGNLSNATTNSNGKLNQFANLYLNYPIDEDAMTDGTLPVNFPAPFPDDDGDKMVSQDEFDTVINSANGSISFELDPSLIGGSVTAGVAYGVPAGSTYSGSSLPVASNSALSQLQADGSYDGNLILIGTDSDPIVIDRKVAVNGDIIIKGKVKGWGQIYAKGNVYVAGDVTYADAPGEFGVASDGTTNGFALTAGGSIMMGDYLTIRAKQHTADTGKYPAGGFIDMRQSNRTVTLTKSGQPNQSHTIGYFDSGVSDTGAAQGSQPQLSFTTSELMLFNKREYEKAQASPSYKPRYYRLKPSAPVYRYSSSDEHTVKYNESGVVAITNLTNAAVHDLNPQSFWVSETQMRNFWYADEMTRPSSGRPLQFDGLLYSNNSIFCITRSSGRHNSNTRGRMLLRGGVVSADLGVFVPGPDFAEPRTALQLYYDKRVANFLRVEDTTRVAFRRMTYRPLTGVYTATSGTGFTGDSYDGGSGNSGVGQGNGGGNGTSNEGNGNGPNGNNGDGNN